ncbi:BREX system serine/threonine kinase PglW [Microterricola viridarii]|uniref:Serine/threonine protein kinase n=1 Tax=Microterricola viridarii TaxID=412690 RepID=A0A0X8E4D7_9MICO|nr:BREX system serine/threonine kinase PglW [Microterricola viridarii]AMB59188.1 hypothetical protein AWU67_10290 [Microterricola viridarii]
MKADSPNWIVMGKPAQSLEGAALSDLRELLPDDGITTAWVNLTFVANGGGFNEVDVLLLTKAGLFVVELKGWHGQLLIKQNRWHQNGRDMGNPPVAADSKAKKLSGLLASVAQKHGANKNVVPWLGSLMVLHGRDSKVNVEPNVHGITTLDGYNIKMAGPGKEFSKFLAAPASHLGDAVDKARAAKIRQIIEQADLKPTPKTRKVGDYNLDAADPLGENEDWVDLLATHPRTKSRRRIRVFKIPRGTSKAAFADIQRHAVREFRLTDGISHKGITHPIEYVDSSVGPALVFEYDDREVSLGDYLDEHAATLSIEQRVTLVRKIAEVMKAAHSRRVMHRALSPLRVTVRSSKKGVSVAVRDWFAGQKAAGGTTLSRTMLGTTDIPEAIAEAEWGYLAPEVVQYLGEPSPIALDVYGLGALAYRIFTDRDPSENSKDLHALYQSADSLDPLAVQPELPEVFAEVVREATSFDESMRTIDVGALLVALESATEEYLARGEKIKVEIDPLDASPGEIIGDRFEITARRGAGTTGVALLVDDYETAKTGVILKLARDDEAASRLALEAEVLAGLEHPRVVRLLNGPLEVGGRSALVLSDAGAETLAARLQTEGRSTIEQLESYGRDLLEAVRYLDGKGVFHRDIKPANLAIAPDPGTRKPRLTLFDLSLAREPLTHTKSGSRPYLDPYLDLAGRRQYDRSAELFSVAATLFEMAAGMPPFWPGGNAPEQPSEAPVVQSSQFEESHAAPLAEFFTRALAPEAKARFATLDEFEVAWLGLFAESKPENVDASTTELLDAQAAAATLDTPLAEAGLSVRARSGLGRLRVSTVGELLGVPPMQINQIRGLGELHRKEVQRRVREWRTRLKQEAGSTIEAAAGRLSIERHRSTLIPRMTAENSKQVTVLRLLLGEDQTTGDAPWPSFTSIADQLGLQVAAVSRLVSESVARWRKEGKLRDVVEDVANIVNDFGLVATHDEVADQLLQRYGSAKLREERRRHARGLVRAVVELDATAEAPRLDKRRPRDERAPVLLATIAAENAGGGEPDVGSEQLLAMGRSLGDEIDKMLSSRDVAPAAFVRDRLRRIVPTGVDLSDARLLDFAVAASTTGAKSSLDEVYRCDLSPARAIEVALGGVAVRELTPDSIERRVKGRFRLITAIPPHPALDAIVHATHPHLEWNLDRYLVKDGSTYGASTRSTTLQGSLPNDTLAPTLAESVQHRSALVLTTTWGRYDDSATALAARFGVEVVDLAALAVEQLHATAASVGADWLVVVDADKPDASTIDKRNLQALAKQAMSSAWAEINDRDTALLFTNAAVLAHLGLVDLIARTIDLSTKRAAARWFLLPKHGAAAVPDLDGTPMPIGAGKWIELPTTLAAVLPIPSSIAVPAQNSKVNL